MDQADPQDQGLHRQQQERRDDPDLGGNMQLLAAGVPEVQRQTRLVNAVYVEAVTAELVYAPGSYRTAAG